MGPAARYLVWGAGGHGAVVADVILALGHELAGFVDRDPGQLSRLGEEWTSVSLVLETELISGVGSSGRLPADGTALALGIGHNATRLDLARRLSAVALPSLAHPSAVVSGRAALARGTVVMPGAVVNARSALGVGTIVNTGAVIEHDCAIGDGCHVAPGAVLGGGVTLGEEVLIGAGAVVLPGVTIGDRATVGAGAIVLRDVAMGTTVVGNPASPLHPKGD